LPACSQDTGGSVIAYHTSIFVKIPIAGVMATVLDAPMVTYLAHHGGGGELLCRMAAQIEGSLTVGLLGPAAAAGTFNAGGLAGMG